jgi:hypothetical protein
MPAQIRETQVMVYYCDLFNACFPSKWKAPTEQMVRETGWDLVVEEDRWMRVPDSLSTGCITMRRR